MKTALQIRISNYENWISSECKGEIPDNMQKELLKLFSESQDAYTYYRNYLFSKSADLNDESIEISEFIKFLVTSNHLNEHSELIRHYSKEDTLNNFKDKRMNIVEIASENTKTGLSQNACFLYQSYYEIETILLIFASFAILNNEHRAELHHNNLRDRSGRLKKGVCIDYVKTRLKEFPRLLTTFSSAYNVKLRNTIGHNNYRIKEESIESIDGSIKVAQDEFFESLYNLQKLNNFLIYYFSSNSINENDLKDCGILSIGFDFDNDKPVLIVHQLECFYQLDNDKSWFKKVEFNMRENLLETVLSYRTPMKGVLNEQLLDWLETLKSQRLLKVIIQSIMPPVSDTANLIQIDCGSFEICDENYETEIEYKINTCHNNSS